MFEDGEAPYVRALALERTQSANEDSELTLDSLALTPGEEFVEETTIATSTSTTMSSSTLKTDVSMETTSII